MKKYILLIIFVLFNNCTTAFNTTPDGVLSPNDELPPKIERPILTEEQKLKANQEPYFAVNFNGFLVKDEDSNADGATSVDHQAARKLTSAEKRRMLELLDLVRLVVNSAEFEAQMKSQIYRAGRTASGPQGTISPRSVYDNDRLLHIITNIVLYVQIRKIQIVKEALAVGLVGESLYVLNDSDARHQNSYWVGFPNRDNWAEDKFYRDERFMSGILFHEILHNAGFSHLPFIDPSTPDPHDVVYHLQFAYNNAYDRLISSLDFLKRKDSFEPFYPEVFASHVAGDTGAIAFSIMPGIRMDDPVVCIIQPDGSFKLIKLSEIS